MKFLVCLFIIILCAQALSSLAVETLSTTRDRDTILSKHLMQEQENKGVNVTTSLHGGSDRRGHVLKQAEVYSIKSQRGKAASGGVNIDSRPRPPDKSAASGPKRSLFFILSPTILYAGFSWILLLPF